MSDSDNTEDQEPKIIVDSDWKEQVAKEKDSAGLKAQESADSSSPRGEVSEDQLPPPASFESLVSMLFTQTMAMLGQIPDPNTNEATVNKPLAKHFIDTMDVLGDKTSGNLNEDESKMLADALHALRMAYVNVKG